MRLVEVDENLVRKRVPCPVEFAVAAQNVFERTGDEEVLLPQAQFLAGHRVVVGVENLGQVLGEHLRLHRFDVAALVEVGEIELLHRPRRPEAQGVDRVAVADDRQVVGNALDVFGGDPPPLLAAGDVETFDMAAEVDELRILRTLHLPRIAVLEPAVGLFDLGAVDDLLAEDAVVVPETVAHAGEIERRHRIEIACRKASEAAVAQTRIRLVVPQVVPVDAVFLERVAAELVGLEVDDVVSEKPSHQKFKRKIVDALGVFAEIFLLGADPALDGAVSDGVGESRILIALGRAAVALGERIAQMPRKILLQPLHRHLDAAVFLLCSSFLHFRLSHLKSDLSISAASFTAFRSPFLIRFLKSSAPPSTSGTRAPRPSCTDPTVPMTALRS